MGYNSSQRRPVGLAPAGVRVRFPDLDEPTHRRLSTALGFTRRIDMRPRSPHGQQFVWSKLAGLTAAGLAIAGLAIVAVGSARTEPVADPKSDPLPAGGAGPVRDNPLAPCRRRHVRRFRGGRQDAGHGRRGQHHPPMDLATGQEIRRFAAQSRRSQAQQERRRQADPGTSCRGRFRRSPVHGDGGN